MSRDRDAIRRSRLATVVAVAVAAFAVATIAFVYTIDAALGRLGRPDLYQGRGVNVVFLVGLVASTTVAVALLVRRPEHSVGWCFAGLSASIALSGLCQSYAVYALLAYHPTLAGGGTAAALLNPLFLVWLVLLARVCLRTPTGYPQSTRWGWVDRALVATGVLTIGSDYLLPGHLGDPLATIDNPWGIGGWLGTAFQVIHFGTLPVTIALVISGPVSLVVRFRRAVGDERRQLLWMALVAVPFPFLVVVGWIASRLNDIWLVNTAAALWVTLIPVAAGLAVGRYHLYDVDRILSRALSYLLVSAVLAATFTVVVVLITRAVGQTINRSPVAVSLATLAVAVAARPVYSAVQDAIDRRFARRRHDALRRVTDFVANPDPHRSIDSVLREALADPDLTVAYWVDDRSQWVNEDGAEVSVSDESLMVRRAERPIAAVRYHCDATLAAAVIDRARSELDNAGLRAAVSLQLQEVRASRQRIAAAHTAERERIERDLHDGAQQRLLALAAHLQAALLNGASGRLRAALRHGVAESRAAVVELRDLANGLHPSVLHDGGLEAAISDLARRLPIRIDIDLDGRRYSPHVESTAWFVVCEAVSNAVKHAGPAAIDVRVSEADGLLHLTIDDDGRGGIVPNGSGIRGLRDRAAAVGGRLDVTPRQPSGTRVAVELPCGP
jgi:signal transduction histidine kinase